jgi:hypothetical protein
VRRFGLAVGLALCLAVAGTGGTARADDIAGTQRVLFVLVTWGPEPFTQEQVRTALGEATAFVHASSYGRASLAGTVTPWLHSLAASPRGCDVDPIGAAGRAAAARAGFAPADYPYVVFVHPAIACNWFGLTEDRDIYLNGSLFPKLVEHELGHAFGLGHANTAGAGCSAEACATEYGDPYDTMGSGTGDFNPYEKSLLGWLPRWTVAQSAGTYDVDTLEPASGGPKALVVRTALNEYWIENRRDPGRTVDGEIAGPPGVLIRTGPPRILANGIEIFTFYNLLLDDPAGRGRAAMLPGDRVTVPGAFTLAVVARSRTSSRVRFAWTDRTPPAAPVAVGTRLDDLGELAAVWGDSRETGSGVARYVVSLDDRRPVVVGSGAGRDNELPLAALGAGRHVLRIVAVDRAGNRSRAAVRSFVVGR